MQKIFLGLIIAMAIYEVIALYNRESGDTISEIIWHLSAQRPLIPFAIGLLCGHFFWQKVD